MFDFRIGDFIEIMGRGMFGERYRGRVTNIYDDYFIVQTKNYKIAFNYVDIITGDIFVRCLREVV